MIKTLLTREDALRILELGEQLHKESRFRDFPFNVEKCWNLLESTVLYPYKRFIAFDDEYRGFIIMGISEHYFTDVKEASDFCLYVAPEHRGGRLVIRLLQAAKEWAQANGAAEFTIFHNTGIQTEASPKLFEKLGLPMQGYIFSTEIPNV